LAAVSAFTVSSAGVRQRKPAITLHDPRGFRLENPLIFGLFKNLPALPLF
jgi:hypothetical protein